MQTLSSYAARQQSSVNLLGRIGWGKIGPGCSILVVSSVVKFFRIFLPGSPVNGCMLAMSPLGLEVPLLGVLGMRPFVGAAPLGEVFVLFLLGGDSLPVSP